MKVPLLKTGPHKGSPLYSGKDVNDKLMFDAGFIRDAKMDPLTFNACGDITYWWQCRLRIRVITSKDVKLTLDLLLRRVADQVANNTRTQLQKKIAYIDFSVNGYIPID